MLFNNDKIDGKLYVEFFMSFRHNDIGVNVFYYGFSMSFRKNDIDVLLPLCVSLSMLFRNNSIGVNLLYVFQKQ